MLPMTKVMENGSHFELVSGKELEERNIIQIYPKKVYKNAYGYAVFLCEVLDEKVRNEYEHKGC